MEGRKESPNRSSYPSSVTRGTTGNTRVPVGVWEGIKGSLISGLEDPPTELKGEQEDLPPGSYNLRPPRFSEVNFEEGGGTRSGFLR